jgi:hypothetical protein
MRTFIIIFLLGFTMLAFGQVKKPDVISISYYGEMITHPGFKISADFDIKEWDKTKATKKDSSKTINKNLILSPTMGLFYHKRYQTGLFFIPEIKYKRQNPKGRFYEVGIGSGYFRTFIPNTYEVNSNGAVNKTNASYNYFASNFFISFGKDLSIKKNLPIAYFIKPQFMYAVPNFPNGTGYFALELGLCYSLKH